MQSIVWTRSWRGDWLGTSSRRWLPNGSNSWAKVGITLFIGWTECGSSVFRGDVHFGDPACDLMVAFSLFSGVSRDAFFETYGLIDTPTRRLARFRALHHTLSLIQYASDLADSNLLSESLNALNRLIQA